MGLTLEVLPVDTETPPLDPSRLIPLEYKVPLYELETTRFLQIVVSRPRPFHEPHDGPRVVTRRYDT